ncbi:MAG: hypothetical protein MI923_23745 [Phycisphaerales bacterium]|nr:hypothetical protein [Phycisphaerales bacterium]
MFLSRVVWVSAVGLLTLAGVGCNRPEGLGRLNAPPQGDSDDPHDMSEYFSYHSDQGALSDLSITDIHFVPHSDELSGVGEAKLEQYAGLLATRGGTLHYETSLPDLELIDARIAVANEFLAEVIPSNNRIEVARGLSRGRGMTARESIPAQGVAKQPEPRGTAYNLRDAGGDAGT